MRRGAEYIAGLKDGRSVFIDGERVSDVTEHPAFRESVRSVARLYDIASDPANEELMTYVPPGSSTRANRVFTIPRSREDLTLRRRAIERWAQETLGFMGRSPDHVAGFLAGFAGAPDLFARGGDRYAENVVRFYEVARDRDLYVTYVIVPPQIDRSKPAHQQSDPHLYAGVVSENADGIVVRGAQMLGTGSAISDWILLSSIHPLRPGDENYAISVAVPAGAPGVKIFSRRSYATGASSTFDYPLSTRFDETDSLLVFDDVFVPWEHVFVYRNVDLCRAQFFETAAHAFGNNQAQIRYATKMRFLTGLIKRIVEMNQGDQNPAIRGEVGEIAAHAAMVEGLVLAQEEQCTIDGNGVARPGMTALYANMIFQSENYATVLHKMRLLSGGGLIQLPSSSADFANPETRRVIDTYVTAHEMSGYDRTKLMKLAWDAIGSEFASRHQQYEMFYAGAPFIVKGHLYRHYDFVAADALVERALSGYDLDGRHEPVEPASEPSRNGAPAVTSALA